MDISKNIEQIRVSEKLSQQQMADILGISQQSYNYFIKNPSKKLNYDYVKRIKIGNIDWQNMSIVVPSSASKNRKQESVVIPDSFLPILEEMKLQLLPADWYLFGRKLEPGPVQYINYNHISTRHNAYVEEFGISKEKGLYSWKHSGVCALYPIIKGDLYSMMRQLRHSELTTTQIYLKSLGLADNTAIRKAVW